MYLATVSYLDYFKASLKTAFQKSLGGNNTNPTDKDF
jgi:hypothetical protein